MRVLAPIARKTKQKQRNLLNIKYLRKPRIPENARKNPKKMKKKQRKNPANKRTQNLLRCMDSSTKTTTCRLGDDISTPTGSARGCFTNTALIN